jgi:hypothetical protein
MRVCECVCVCVWCMHQCALHAQSLLACELFGAFWVVRVWCGCGRGYQMRMRARTAHACRERHMPPMPQAPRLHGARGAPLPPFRRRAAGRAAGRAAAPPQALLRELLIHSEDRMASMAGPEFAYIIAALAKLKSGPDTAWLNRRAKGGGGGRARGAPVGGRRLLGGGSFACGSFAGGIRPCRRASVRSRHPGCPLTMQMLHLGCCVRMRACLCCANAGGWQ